MEDATQSSPTAEQSIDAGITRDDHAILRSAFAQTIKQIIEPLLSAAALGSHVEICKKWRDQHLDKICNNFGSDVSFNSSLALAMETKFLTRSLEESLKSGSADNQVVSGEPSEEAASMLQSATRLSQGAEIIELAAIAMNVKLQTTESLTKAFDTYLDEVRDKWSVWSDLEGRKASIVTLAHQRGFGKWPCGKTKMHDILKHLDLVKLEKETQTSDRSSAVLAQMFELYTSATEAKNDIPNCIEVSEDTEQLKALDLENTWEAHAKSIADDAYCAALGTFLTQVNRTAAKLKQSDASAQDA